MTVDNNNIATMERRNRGIDMKTEKEFVEVCGVLVDEKARRRSNVSTAVANIAAEEIQRDGVTLERLATIGVPVYRYKTQVTIHGVLPDIGFKGVVHGYKCLVENENGSLGVRYCAIDAGKKAALQNILQLARPECKWSVHITSSETTISRFTSTKEECLAALQSVPRDAFVGHIYGYACLYGGYMACLDVGAIPQKTFWKLSATLGGVSNQEEWDAILAKKAEQDKIDTERYKAECAERRARSAVEETRCKEELIAFCNTLPGRLSKMPPLPCTVMLARSVATYSSEGAQYTNMLVELYYEKGAFGKVYVTQKGDGRKRRVADLENFQKWIDAGYVFAKQ